MRLAVFLLCLAQSGDLASTLKASEWKAVDELGAKPELKSKLAALAEGKDAEAAWWAGAALAELEARENAGKAWAPPVRITMKANEASVGELLRELVSRAKGRGLDVAEGDHPVTVAFRETPYLQALDEICRQAGLVLARGAGGKLQAVVGEPPHGPRFYHAGFAVSVLSLVRRTDVTFREAPVSQLQMTLSLRGEPSLRILDEEVACALSRVEDDTGRSLLKEETKVALRVRGAPEGGAAGAVGLAVPAPGAKKIALVRGLATVTLARTSREIVFENVGKGETQERESGGIKASLKKTTRTGEDVRLELELSGPEKVFWPSSENLILEDAEGRAYQRWGSSMNSSGTSASYETVFRNRDGAGPPDKFRVTVVTESTPRKVYFELKDVLLR